MTISVMTDFFMWCTILNIGIMAFWMIFLIFAPEFTYRLQARFFPMPRETWNIVIYSFLGIYKIMFLIFALIPYLTLLIIR